MRMMLDNDFLIMDWYWWCIEFVFRIYGLSLFFDLCVLYVLILYLVVVLMVVL